MSDEQLDPTVERDLARVDAAAALVMDRCPHCSASYELLAMRDGLPAVMGVTHEEGCPEWIPDWP
jgi:hypothetical protein